MSEHGTHSRYSRGCRCDACRDANRVYHGARRKAREGNVPPALHGTANAYQNYNCRCERCRLAAWFRDFTRNIDCPSSALGRSRSVYLQLRRPVLYPVELQGQSTVTQPLLTSLPPRMQAKITVEGACWIWTGAVQSSGYGSIGIGNGHTALAHRYAYMLLVGPIPEGLTIDHLCRRQLCQNPAHMEPVPLAENLRRRPKYDACIHGHSFGNGNARVRLINGSPRRDCRECANAKRRVADPIRPRRRPVNLLGVAV